MPLTFNKSDEARMIEIQREVSQLLLRINGQRKTEAAIVAFALVRAARELLSNYPEATTKDLTMQVVVPFLLYEPATEPTIITIQ